MHKAILWDNDGVLVETEKWYYEATKRVMKEEGYNLTLDQYHKTFIKNNTGAWHLLKNCDKEYSRIGSSILTAINHKELIAKDKYSLVKNILDLVQNKDKLLDYAKKKRKQ